MIGNTLFRERGVFVEMGIGLFLTKKGAVYWE